MKSWRFPSRVAVVLPGSMYQNIANGPSLYQLPVSASIFVELDITNPDSTAKNVSVWMKQIDNEELFSCVFSIGGQQTRRYQMRFMTTMPWDTVRFAMKPLVADGSGVQGR